MLISFDSKLPYARNRTTTPPPPPVNNVGDAAAPYAFLQFSEMQYLILTYEEASPNRIPTVNISTQEGDAPHPDFFDPHSTPKPIHCYLDQSPSHTSLAFDFSDARGFKLNLAHPTASRGVPTRLPSLEGSPSSLHKERPSKRQALERLRGIKCGESVSSPEPRAMEDKARALRRRSSAAKTRPTTYGGKKRGRKAALCCPLCEREFRSRAALLLHRRDLCRRTFSWRTLSPSSKRNVM
ncbi:MAG: hypothetical protein LQ340_002191 [Diploschistes diacapsis]|nr:MAG: hypothetical protein LQ340_002191 [Diploschistes diacapsis]